MESAYDDQVLVLDELKAALATFKFVPTNEVDHAAVDLMAFIGQARRLQAHLMGPGAMLPEPLGGLPAVTAAAMVAAIVGERRIEAALDTLVPTECVDALAASMSWGHEEDCPPPVLEVLGALYECDRIFSAWGADGRDLSALLEDAEIVVRTAPEVSEACAPACARFVQRHGAVGGAAPIFALVASYGDKEVR